MADESLHITLAARLARQVAARGLGSVVIPRDLERYYLLLAQARYGLRNRFSAAEINLICRVLAEGMLWEGLSVTTFVETVVRGIEQLDDSRFAEVDRLSAQAQLMSLDAQEVTAFVDALERFWLDAWWDNASDWAPGLALWDRDQEF
jgi:hypothetical protein